MACEAKWNWAWEPEDRLPASRVTCDSVVCKRERFSQTPTFEVECGVRECLSFLREHRVLWHETKWLVWTIPPSYWSLSILSHAKTHHACRQEMVKKCRGCWSRDEIMYEQETYIYVLQSITNDWDYTLAAEMQCHFVIFEHHICTKTITYMTRFCHITRENVSN